MKILVRGTNWIGDSVMSVPALRKLRISLPDAQITLASPAWAEGLFRDADFLDEILVIRSPGHSLRSIRAQAAEYRKGGFDAAIIFTNSFVSALTVRASGIGKRYGYAAEGRGFLLTRAFRKPDWKDERHESGYYSFLVGNAVRELGAVPAEVDGSGAIPVSAERREKIRDLLVSRGIEKGEPFAVLGAGSTNSRAKRWPADRFAEVAETLKNAHGLKIVLLGSEGERDVAQAVSAASSCDLLDLTGETALESAVEILAEASVMVSNDMGLAHIAAAVGTPTVTIFGPTNPRTTAPLGSAIVREEVECSPCMLRDCPIDHRCMTRISPQRVAREAAELMARQD